MSRNGHHLSKEDAKDVGVLLTTQLSVQGNTVEQNSELQNGLYGQYSKIMDSTCRNRNP